MADCLFCKIEKGEIPAEKIYEDDKVFAIKDINPQAPTHILIITKKHFSSLMDVEEADAAAMGSVMMTGKKIATDLGLDKSGFRIVNNCGKGAGQSVFHIHFHLLGGRAMQWPPG